MGSLSQLFPMANYTLGLLGVWPLDTLLDPKTMIKIVLNLSVVLTAIVGEIRFAWFKRSKPLEAINAACPSLTKTMTMTKIIFFLIFRNELRTLLNELYEHLSADTKNSKKKTMITKISSFTKNWVLMLHVFGLCTSFLYTFQPVFVWAYYRFIENKATWVTLSYQAALPYEDMTQVNYKFYYAIVYCLLAHSGNVAVFGISGVDGLFMSFSMYISVSYECLQEDYKDAFKTFSESNLDSRCDQLYNDLSLLVKRQQRIIEMFHRFNRIYKFIIVGHFLFASIEMGIILVNMSLTTGLTRIQFFFYLLGAFCELYTYCYGAESMNTNCSKLSETLYFCEWYHCNKKVKNLVLFVLVKAQQGSLLNSPFFMLSLPLFASLIQTAGSYFTILQTIL